VFQVLRTIPSVLLSDDVSVILEPPKISSAIGAAATAIKGSAEFPFGCLVVPREFLALGDGTDGIKVVRHIIGIGIISIVLFVLYAHVGVARMVDEDRWQVHEDVPVPIDLNGVRVSRRGSQRRLGRDDQISDRKIFRGKQPQTLVVGRFSDLEKPLVFLVRGTLSFELIVIVSVYRWSCCC